MMTLHGDRLFVVHGDEANEHELASLARRRVVGSLSGGAGACLVAGQALHICSSWRHQAVSLDDLSLVADTAIKTPGKAFKPTAMAFVGPAGLVAFGHSKSVTLWALANPLTMVGEVALSAKPVTALASSFDGALLAVATKDRALHLVDVMRREPVATLTGHRREVLALAFVGPALLAAVGAEGAVTIWDIDTKLPRHVIEGVDGRPSFAAAVGREGLFVTGGLSSALQLFDAAAGLLVGDFADARRATLVASSHERDDLVAWVPLADASAGGSLISLSPAALRASAGTEAPPLLGLVAAGPRAVSSHDDGSLRVHDGATGRVTHVIAAHRSVKHVKAVLSLAVSSDCSKLLTAGGDRTVRLFDIEQGRDLRVFKGHKSWVFDAAFLPAEREALSVSWDGTARRFSLSGKQVVTIEVPPPPMLTHVAVSPDGKAAVLSNNDSDAPCLHVVDLERGTTRRVSPHRVEVEQVTVLGDGRRVLSLDDQGTLCLWDIATGATLWQIEGGCSTAEVFRLDAAQRRCLFAVAGDAALVVDVERGESVARLEGHRAAVIDGVLVDEHRAVTVSKDGLVRLFSLSGELLATWSRGLALVGCAMLRDGVLAVGVSTGEVAMLRLPAP